MLAGAPIGAARPDRAARARPLRRAGGAQRPRRGRRFHARRQWRAHRAPAHGLHAGRPHQRERAPRPTPTRSSATFSVKALGPSLDGGLAVGRQPAEIHHGPRNPAGADGARRQPADLGRRRRRGGARSARRSSISPGAAAPCVVVSQDLDELLEFCDSLVVINLGSLSRVMKVGEVSIEEIGLLMGGVHGDPDATVEMTEASACASDLRSGASRASSCRR